MKQEQFLIEFDILEDPDANFFELIPQQREVINKMMSEGKILSYTLSQDRLKLWCIMTAHNEIEIMERIADFPLIDYMTPQIFPLMFHNSVFLAVPAFSKN
jgi:muconolactone delta-isomerase